VQLIVVIAFAIVLGMPDDGWPHPVLHGGPAVLAILATVTALMLVTSRAVDRAVLASLERPGMPISRGQAQYVRGQLALRAIILLGYLALVGLTEFTGIVRHWIAPVIVGVDEIIMLLPFFAWLILGYICIYPADRAIRTSSIEQMLRMDFPVRPIWSARRFLAFQLRSQVLIIAAPMILIIIAKDLIELYRNELSSISSLQILPEVTLGFVAMVVFTLSPQMIRLIWRSYRLPDGPLRTRLEALANKTGLRYRDILIWPSDSMMMNAVVMGLVGPLRYIMLSDGLIETMTDTQIAAVFGHEIGHVKKHHIPFYLIFAFSSIGLLGLGGIFIQNQLHLPQWFFEATGAAAVLGVWLFLFGMLSRRFEWEADLFAAKCLDSDVNQCTSETCRKHDQSENAGQLVLCQTAAEILAGSLERIGALNGIPGEARSWRHGSIAGRCSLIRKLASDPKLLARFETRLWLIRFVLLTAGIICCAAGLHVLRQYEM